VIWAGSDDGLVHVTRDGGKTWQNVTPPDIGDFTRVSIIEASPHDGRHRVRRGQPLPARTTCARTSTRRPTTGAPGRRSPNGIPAEEFTRVIREDPERRGLLYAGTERGVWVSFDDGARWQSLQAQPAAGAGARPRRQGGRPRRGHARALVLDPRRPDPRTAATPDDFAAQLALALQIRDKLTETHEAINMIRALRKQAESWVERTAGTPQAEQVAEAAKPLRDALTAVEDELIQGRSKSHEDPLNFPIKLNNKLAALSGIVGSADAAPTQGARQVFTDVAGRVDAQLEGLEAILVSQLGAFNATVQGAQLPAIVPPEKKW
jgi:hypothetical protein